MVVNLSYDGAIATTPSDTANDPKGPFAGLLVAATGTIKFVDAAGNTVTMAGSPLAGVVIPVKCVRVFSTGTSATVYGLIGVA